MQSRFELINYLAAKINARSYLEIGTLDPDNTFNKINVERKICIDPDPEAKPTYTLTSDEYFLRYKDMFDIIFIDGLHEANQVRRDFENSLKCLENSGYIVMHDCNPRIEGLTHYPGINGLWYGDVYKFAMTLSEYGGIDFRTLNFDCGCAVIWKDPTKKGKLLKMDISWETFEKNREKLLRLVNKREFKEVVNPTGIIKKIYRYITR
jgi:hypothetical protein